MSFERYGFVITVSYENPLLKGPVDAILGFLIRRTEAHRV